MKVQEKVTRTNEQRGVVIYTRSTSTDSIQQQLARCRAFMASKGYVEAKTPIIDTNSGSCVGPRLRELVTGALEGRRTTTMTIVVDDLTRLCRSTWLLRDLKIQWSGAGIEIVAASDRGAGTDQPPVGSASGLLLEHLIELVRESSSRRISEQTKKGIRAKREPKGERHHQTGVVPQAAQLPAKRSVRPRARKTSGGP